jgi:hypothetical protein
VHLVYADETHLWFKQGVGITGMWDWHDGTYNEYRVRLIRFQPAHDRASTPRAAPQSGPAATHAWPEHSWRPMQPR